MASLFASCSSEAEASQVLVLTGSSTVAPLAAEIALRFEQQHPGTRIDVQSGGSSRGITDVRLGNADIGMASRALVDSELDLTAHTIARDGVALIVHSDNQLTALTAEQVRGIFRGELTNWSEVGGSGGEIIVVSKAEGRATLTVFLDHFGLVSREIAADVIAGENEQAIKTIVGAPGAIAYVSIGTAEVDRAAGVPIRLVTLDGVPATAAEVALGLYPLARPLNLLTTSHVQGLAAEFIAFAKHADQGDLVLAESFVPVAPVGLE
ncbi:MAG: phosphate transport system substrate-binding protein [Bacteroidia bacterium]|jgi:phosphate transport system substrate-binding protein